MNRPVAIAGIGLSDYPVSPFTPQQHIAQAFQRALADSGIAKAEVDGLFVAGDSLPHIDDALNTAEQLGIRPKYFDSTYAGGAAFEFHMQHAIDAIGAGSCEVALIVYGSDARSRGKRVNGAKGSHPTMMYDPAQPTRGPLHVGGPMAFEASYGVNIISSYALAAQRHMFEFGTTSEQLAEIAVAIRYNAGFNPNALYRDPITVDDVLNSRMMAEPLHQLDCCVVSDGGGAIIVTTAERAADLQKAPVHVLSGKSKVNNWQIGEMPDFTLAPIADVSDELFAAAGIDRKDIDVLELYDSFTITVLMQLEGLGFCKRGEGGEFVSDGKLALGGALPTNTDGGGLSSSHPGMRGIFSLIEATRQIRGEGGDAQVPDCNFALATGSGGLLSTGGAVILGKDRP